MPYLSFLSVQRVHNGKFIEFKNRIMNAREEPHIWTVWEHKLYMPLLNSERIVFLSLFCIVTFVAVVGNLLTIYVVASRKQQRLLFKTCLLSLALSDLIYSLTVGVTYISRLLFNASSLWYLGSYGCYLIPFFQTSSLLSGSFSLVTIAVDRYMAVFNTRKGHWHPNWIFCATGFAMIHGISFGISSPTIFSYATAKVFVIPEREEDMYEGVYCFIRSDKEEQLYYFSTIFTFVFLPLFVTFICFNGIIAREIWKRRKMPGARKQKKINEDSSTTEVGGKSTNDTNSTSLRNNNSSKDSTISTITQQPIQAAIPQSAHNDNRCNERQRRQMRMFKVILVLMCVFIMFRLPNWIFLLYKLSVQIEPSRTSWLITYSFSIAGILNSMVNPFLYTFLSETIRFTARIRNACNKFCKLCRAKDSQQNYANNEAMFNVGGVVGAKFAPNMRANDNEGVYLGN